MEAYRQRLFPGGTTIEGVMSLQKNGFEASVASAVQAAVEKDKML